VTSAIFAPERVPILAFLTNFFIGGTERQVVNLIQKYDRARFEVHLACFRATGPLLEEIERAEVALTTYPITTIPSPRTVWQQLRLARYIRAHGIRIVHSFGFYANVFAIPAARLGRADVVVASIRDTGSHLTWLQLAMQGWACRFADHVLVNAEAIQSVLEGQGYDPSRISVIRNGVDVSRFQGCVPTDAVRPRLGMSPTALVVAMFARLNRFKGTEYFLQAAALLANRFPEVTFLVVGDSISPAYRSELEERVTALGLGERVVFAGFRNDVPEILSEVCISVLPSLSEGLSNVILEAMAAGVAVVATSVGGTPEIIEDGVSGLLVPPHDASALAQAIGSLLANPARRRSIGQAGQRRVHEQFSLTASVRSTERLYEELLRSVPERRVTAKGGLRRADARQLNPGGQPLGPEQWR
jgi:glycosyltransferase involved in cell wall biosynthesis